MENLGPHLFQLYWNCCCLYWRCIRDSNVATPRSHKFPSPDLISSPGYAVIWYQWYPMPGPVGLHASWEAGQWWRDRSFVDSGLHHDYHCLGASWHLWSVAKDIIVIVIIKLFHIIPANTMEQFHDMRYCIVWNLIKSCSHFVASDLHQSCWRSWSRQCGQLNDGRFLNI